MKERAQAAFEVLMREGVHPTKVVGKPIPPASEYGVQDMAGLRIERNLPVTLRDGVRMFVDIYRPAGTAGEGNLPALLGWSPYGQHKTSDRLIWPQADVAPGWISAFTAFEAPDPFYWCGNGYSVVYPDPRGCWYSEGEQRHGGIREAEDCYDLIEWLAAQPWSNGKVGMAGVSYLTAIQWQVAPLRPPHLAAINPWEGFTDWYREFAYHGDIPDTSFLVRGCANLQWSTTRTEDTPANAQAHPLQDAYWLSKECDLEAIEVPAFVVAKKWHYFYRPESREKQRQFFDHFLKHRAAVLPGWPPVLIEVRERANVGDFRAENEWPLARTRFRRLYLDASTSQLQVAPLGAASEVRHQPSAPEARVLFDYAFAERTELTGHMKLRLWVEVIDAEDMDLFVALQKLDREGREVPFVFYIAACNGMQSIRER